MPLSYKSALAAILSLSTSFAVAAVSPQEASKLGQELTPIGAEKAGNATGTIPAWTGGLTEGPGGFSNEQGYLDPFADDQPAKEITAQNYQKYADQLTEGQKAMFQRYPETFKMPIYQTRRTAAYPEFVYEKAKANATTAQLMDNGNGIDGYDETVPFAIPKTGVELVWNHVTRYRSRDIQRTVSQVVPNENGSFNPIVLTDELKFIGDPSENSLFYFKQIIKSPARLGGNVLLVQETINQVKEPRRAWVYNAGQRRVRRAPQVAYDGPGTASDGQRTADNYDMFNGSPDQYTWELKGKKEIFIPYNSYKLMDKSLATGDIIKAGHINQDYTRYELHRVWVVEAKLKDGIRNIYASRTFYFDEDSYSVVYVDHYDARGQLWRIAEAHSAQFYDVKIPWYALEVLYDLNNGRYYSFGLMNETEGYNFDYRSSKKDYTPSALRRAGVR
jgi:hypothetical protein